MIVDEEKDEVLSNMTGKSISYKIDESSHHIFSILRDKLYSNGAESLCRELMTNARDSHIEAGKADVPIIVWLPGSYITFQDQGTGLSPERIEEVFCYYGRSTKRDTNDQQGFFGIGSKSFFSYSSSASITSIYNGIKYEYVAFINETQVGEIKLISQEQTDESNGVSIKIPIKPGDANSFRGYVKKYSQFWDVPPKLMGDNIYGPTEPPKVTLEGTNWKMFSDGNLACYNVLLDGIPYKYTIQNATVPNVTFIFKTGELIPSATREALSICEKNTNALKAAIEVFKTEIKQTTQDAIANTTDFTEVIKAIHSARNFFALNQTEWKWGGGTLKYPYSQDSMLRCRQDYGVMRKVRTEMFNNNEPLPNSLILVPDDFDFDEVKGYITRKINHHRNKHKLPVVYLVKSTHGIPDDLVTKFEDIKISNPSSAAKPPKVKNAPKTTIYVKYRGKASRSIISIDRTNRESILYVKDDPTAFYGHYKGTGQIPIKCVGVQEKDIKLIKGKPGWYTIQEYIEEKLTKSLTKEKIELEYKKSETAKAYYSYSYLKDYLHEDFKVAFESSSLTNEQIQVIKFIEINGELDKPEVPDLYERYPLLATINKSEVDGVPGQTTYSYNIKIKLKDVVEYIQLINEKEKAKL